MNFKNDGLTVGELSITIAIFLIIGFLWTSFSKDRGNKEVTMFINNENEISYPNQISK